MAERTIEDRLREEYFDLLPDIRRVAEHLETEVRHHVLSITADLDKYERLTVRSRVKECDSALEALRRRQQGATFDRDRPESYSLTTLNDLAGVRVLAFPPKRLREVDQELGRRFPDWASDPVPGADDAGDPLAFKYNGFCGASLKVRGELQIVSMLIGLFWEVEHSVVYKPTPQLKGVARSLEVQECTQEIYRALRDFEATLENLIRPARP